MASVAPRKNAQGDIISYQIKVTRGRDHLTGKQLTPYTTTYTPPEGWSRKAVERDLQKFVGEFEAACKRGEILTKAETKQKAIADMKERERQKTEEEKQVTYSKYVKVFLEEKKLTSSINTVCMYERLLSKGRALDYFKSKKMVDIDTATIKQFMSYLQTTAKNEKDGTPLSRTTISMYYSLLKELLQNAVEDNIIPSNPMLTIKRPKGKKDEASNPIVYDEDQVKYIIECLKHEKPMWKALVLFLIDSGCRRGECLGLKWSDIDFSTGKVTISENVQYSGKEQGIYINAPKSGKSRTIFLNKQVLKVMSDWRIQQAESKTNEGLTLCKYCFTNRNGGLMNPGDLSCYFIRFGRKYNLPGFHPHALRHTMATISIANGADIVSVSKKLGHSNPAITLNVYSHANEEAQQRTNEILANAIYA